MRGTLLRMQGLHQRHRPRWSTAERRDPQPRMGRSPQGCPDSLLSPACKEGALAGANYPGPAGESASSPLMGQNRPVLLLVPSLAPTQVCAHVYACTCATGRRGGRNLQSVDGAGAPPGRTSQDSLGKEWDLPRVSQPFRQGEVEPPVCHGRKGGSSKDPGSSLCSDAHCVSQRSLHLSGLRSPTCRTRVPIPPQAGCWEHGTVRAREQESNSIMERRRASEHSRSQAHLCRELAVRGRQFLSPRDCPQGPRPLLLVPISQACLQEWACVQQVGEASPSTSSTGESRPRDTVEPGETGSASQRGSGGSSPTNQDKGRRERTGVQPPPSRDP